MKDRVKATSCFDSLAVTAPGARRNQNVPTQTHSCQQESPLLTAWAVSWLQASSNPNRNGSCSAWDGDGGLTGLAHGFVSTIESDKRLLREDPGAFMADNVEVDNIEMIGYFIV